MVCIIILNWNGYADTIECLKSLYSSLYNDYFVVVGDNGSTDTSLTEIEKYCETESWEYRKISLNEEPVLHIKRGMTILYDLKENNGFSKGNNLMIKYIAQYTPDYYILLNNDTVVEPNFLSLLVGFQQKYPKYKVLSPLIHYYYDKHKIWNGGGNIYWGFRKYHYANKHEKEVREKEFIPCTYITGCSLFFVPEILNADKTLFVEKYFYGEEDFELSLKLKKNKCKMACVVNSVIYHKVGASVKRYNSNIGVVYVHYLNRLMDIKDYMKPVNYFFYRIAFFLNLLIKLMTICNLPLNTSLSFMKRLNADARTLDKVSKEYCLNLFSQGMNVFNHNLFTY
jgi:GT2 family glycosyltransferase